MRFRVPEIFLGVLLTVAVFATGMLFSNQIRPAANYLIGKAGTAEEHHTGKPDDADSSKDLGSSKEQSEFWSAKLTDWLLAGLTFFLALFTYRLWKSTDKLWKSAEADTRIIQRAYLNVIPLGVETSRAGAVAGQVSIRNAGHLPARSVSSSVKIGWFDNRSETKFDSGRIPSQSTVLPAGAEMPRGSGALENGKGVLNAKTGYIYVWGRVTYEDGFGINRWLIFCHRYPCETAEGVPGWADRIDARHARHHHEHNDGD
jgi:hypothetical protein